MKKTILTAGILAVGLAAPAQLMIEADSGPVAEGSSFRHNYSLLLGWRGTYEDSYLDIYVGHYAFGAVSGVHGLVPGSAELLLEPGVEATFGLQEQPQLDGTTLIFLDLQDQIVPLAQFVPELLGTLTFLSASDEVVSGYAIADSMVGDNYEGFTLDGPINVPGPWQNRPPVDPVPEASTVLAGAMIGMLAGGYVVRRRMAGSR